MLIPAKIQLLHTRYLHLLQRFGEQQKILKFQSKKVQLKNTLHHSDKCNFVSKKEGIFILKLFVLLKLCLSLSHTHAQNTQVFRTLTYYLTYSEVSRHCFCGTISLMHPNAEIICVFTHLLLFCLHYIKRQSHIYLH